MSKNNIRGITLVRGPILGIHSLILIISWFFITPLEPYTSKDLNPQTSRTNWEGFSITRRRGINPWYSRSPPMPCPSNIQKQYWGTSRAYLSVALSTRLVGLSKLTTDIDELRFLLAHNEIDTRLLSPRATDHLNTLICFHLWKH